MSKLPGITLTLALLISSAALSGCGTTRTIVKVVCPQLKSPTLRIVDAFEAVGAVDPESAKWVIALDNHYEKLRRCPKRSKT